MQSFSVKRTDGVCANCGAPLDLPDTRTVFGPADTVRLLALEPFAARCERCGSEQNVPRSCIWADEERGLAVRLTPHGEAPIQFEPPWDGMALRDTRHLMLFREKLLLWNAGYDDRVVEAVKLLSTLSADDPDLVLEDIVAVGADADAVRFCGWRPDETEVYFGSPRGLYEKIARELPESLLQTDGFTVVDSAWIGRRVAPAQEK